MKVIIKEPGHMPKSIDINNDLRTLQHLVGGYIEHVRVSKDVGMIINEEGKFNGSEPNFSFENDVIMGTAVFVGYDGEDFADCPESESGIRIILARHNVDCGWR